MFNYPQATERHVRCNTLTGKENAFPVVYLPPQTPQAYNDQLLQQNKRLADQNVKLQNEVNRLEYHLRIMQNNFNQLKLYYDHDQAEIQKLNAHMQQLKLCIEDHTQLQTRVLDLEQENYQLHHEIEHYRNTLKNQQDLENQKQALQIQEQKLLEISRALTEEVHSLAHNPLTELLEVWRDRALKSCTFTGQKKTEPTTREKYAKFRRMAMQAAELMSFKLNYK